MTACTTLYQRCSEEPPHYTTHGTGRLLDEKGSLNLKKNTDWRSAERFWEMRESWSFFRKLREAFRIDQAPL